MRRAVLFVCFLAAGTIASPAQTLTKLADFTGSNGAYPMATLIQGSDGSFYGTTAGGGGANSAGIVFEITSDGQLKTIYSFCSQQNCVDGANSSAALLQVTNGDFYGTTQGGGAFFGGTVFKVTSSGTLKTLYSFCSQNSCADGMQPQTGLARGTDGNFYGTTVAGGTYDQGTVFRITPEGKLTTLHNFQSSDGSYPCGQLVQGSDGSFYGTAYNGGAYEYYGTVFRITPEGKLTTLHNFQLSDGAFSCGQLVEGTDGNFYGTTYGGGAYDAGTIFKILPDGKLTTLHSFVAGNGNPSAGLVQGTDGNFYGTASGSSQGEGSLVFKITATGAFTTLHTLTSAEGRYLFAGLVQGTDGKFYGAAYAGGAYDKGTVFRFDTGSFAPLSVAKNGNGTVSAVDGHIYCGSSCAYPYPIAANVTLSAIPAPGYTFDSWTGCDNANGSYCSLTMTAARSVTATFAGIGIVLTSVAMSPNYVKGGELSAGRLDIYQQAPPGGLSVALSSDHPGVAHPPAFVLVPGGKSWVWFAVKTFPVKSNTAVKIKATSGFFNNAGTLTVGTTSLPPSLH